MAHQLTWRSLVPGLIAVAVLIGIGIAVLVYGSVGRIRGDTITIHARAAQARGVMRGTEVWLEGQRVGLVEDIGFRPASADTLGRVVITMDVRAKDAGQIRRDSEIRVRAGTSLIGPIVVYITAGTPASPAVRDGDTLVTTPPADVSTAMERLGEAAAEADPLLADARSIMARAQDPRGTVGALMREGGGSGLTRLRTSVAELRAALGNGGASDARTRAVASARTALARVDSVRALIAGGHTSLGRFRRDSTLPATIARVRDEVGTLRARLADTTGTLGRMSRDSAITIALASAQREMALLFEDVRKRPLRYIAF